VRRGDVRCLTMGQLAAEFRNKLGIQGPCDAILVRAAPAIPAPQQVT
jgi:hypothetical protein